MHLINCVCINYVEGNEQVLQSLPESVGQCWSNAAMMPRQCWGRAELLPGDARTVGAWCLQMLGSAAVMQGSARGCQVSIRAMNRGARAMPTAAGWCLAMPGQSQAIWV